MSGECVCVHSRGTSPRHRCGTAQFHSDIIPPGTPDGNNQMQNAPEPSSARPGPEQKIRGAHRAARTAEIFSGSGRRGKRPSVRQPITIPGSVRLRYCEVRRSLPE